MEGGILQSCVAKSNLPDWVSLFFLVALFFFSSTASSQEKSKSSKDIVTCGLLVRMVYD